MKKLRKKIKEELDKELIQEGMWDAREVWAQVCMWDNNAGDGSCPGCSFHHHKMTINGNTPHVGDLFRNKESRNGNPTNTSYGIENAIYRVTDTSGWNLGNTYNFPGASNCPGHVGTQFVCLFEWGGNDPYTSANPTPAGGHYNYCKEMMHEDLYWELSDPNNTGAGFPPVGTWYVFHDTLQECEDYCIGTFDCQLTMGTPQGGPNTPAQGGCFQRYPWEINDGFYATIQDCEEGCPYTNASGTSGKYKCADSTCDPQSMLCVKECEECDYYEVLAGNCPYDSEQECKDSDCEDVEAYRCYDCNTPCSQQLVAAGHCPYVQQPNGANDAKAECAAACADTNKWTCGVPDKFGNPRCRYCKQFELSNFGPGAGTTCYNTKQECLDSDCPGKIEDPREKDKTVISKNQEFGGGELDKESDVEIVDIDIDNDGEVDGDFTEAPSKELREEVNRIKDLLR